MLYEDLLVRFPAPRVYATPKLSYLQGEALERACELLRLGWTCAAVALELGYSSGPAFSLAFKRESGETPGAWKKARGVKTKRAGQSAIVRPRKTWSAAELRPKKVKRKRGTKRVPKQDVI